MADAPARFEGLCRDAVDHQALLAAGATQVRLRDARGEPDGAIEWDVRADPGGNEFCVFSPEL